MPHTAPLRPALRATVPTAAQTTNDYASYVAVTGRAERTVTSDEIYVAITLDEATLKGGKTTPSAALFPHAAPPILAPPSPFRPAFPHILAP